MILRGSTLLVLVALVIGCASHPDKHSIAQLRDVDADLDELEIDDSLAKAMDSYRRFLEETPAHTMAPEAMRRLADLQIEKEYGVIGDGQPIELPAPAESASATPRQRADPGLEIEPGASTAVAESEQAFEDRTTARQKLLSPRALRGHDLPDGGPTSAPSGPQQAIETYKQILAEYPWYERNDQVLYQMARAYDELAQPEQAMGVMERLIAEYPSSKYLDEVYFRRAEFFFVRKKYLDAEESYLSVVSMGDSSSFYELALYKLGWALYKQELYEAALHRYVALLDHKLLTGYDFDQAHGEDEERRVSDTFRVVSLSFSNLGGPEVLDEYFSTYGKRTYEDRIYSNLAEFHLTKRRYNDAASVYASFVELNPYHKVAPHFSMRVSEVYAEGNFPLLVVASKRDFARLYGLRAEYWHHFDIGDTPEVLAYLKTNLKDLAGHYHALYQQEGLEEEQPENYAEALQWYREFLTSFPEDVDSPPINYQLADLLLEHEDYAGSAREYERTAYDYPTHAQSSDAGYAAVYAHRENLKVVDGAALAAARRATVDSSLQFADTFPGQEHAPTVLGAAAEDLYDMQDFELAISSAQKLIDRYHDADVVLRRSAWMIIAHSSFDLGRYPEAELGYAQVLVLIEAKDETRQAVIDNLAASIYKQGEQARLLEDYAMAADHFLRIKSAAPTSDIRAAAEYDAAAALIHLQDWSTAATVLEEFRDSHPDHELRPEATRQLASVYHEAGELSRSAREYERVAQDTDDLELRRGAVLVAGELYEEAGDVDEALRVYLQYVDEFPQPLDPALETRFKVAQMYESRGDQVRYHEELNAVVSIDGSAGAERTDRSRYLAAQSALVLTELVYEHFRELELVQPFDESLAEKQRRLDAALSAFEALVAYQVGEVTAAATFYIAEIYGHFSDALLTSERPSDLDTADLASYELVIEEEAYPFEERSIEVHEKNLELMSAGVFNDWVQRSLDRLAELMPGRYAKYEISTGFVGSIESYAYRSPTVRDDGMQDIEVPLPEEVPLPDGETVTQVQAEVGDTESPVNDLAGVSDVGSSF